MTKQLSMLGANGILTLHDIPALNLGTRLAYEVLKDGAWHSAIEIREKVPGTECLRRMRELRSAGFIIERKRSSLLKRVFEYRIRKQDGNY